ncbi:putative Agenet-like domain-containing protein [Rosa chinensis]|uniref:Putative Agenet-like domain-containing protein n=1 Tax=Rosa chinensis TaxID=74649 RepID=A0A2P6PVW2_ROSCH|nr:putative Agenet-like domain-containing protein [Rosa chinensis]
MHISNRRCSRSVLQLGRVSWLILGSNYSRKYGYQVTNYLVEYKHFVEEHDESTPLRETLKVKELRPLPPNIVPSRYSSLKGQRVDAFLNDVWWVGTISRKIDSDYYVVFFENTGEEIACPLSKLRFHMNCVNEQWIPSKKKSAPVSSNRFAPYSLKGRREQLVAL